MADEPCGHIGGRLHVNQGDGPGAGDTEASAHRDASGQNMCGGRPPRRDLIYAKPVDVRLADGRSGVVRHPPFDGKVQAVLPADRKRGRAMPIVPLDDLAERSRIALAKGGGPPPRRGPRAVLSPLVHTHDFRLAHGEEHGGDDRREGDLLAGRPL